MLLTTITGPTQRVSTFEGARVVKNGYAAVLHEPAPLVPVFSHGGFRMISVNHQEIQQLVPARGSAIAAFFDPSHAPLPATLHRFVSRPAGEIQRR
jgi:hypothetical protein